MDAGAVREATAETTVPEPPAVGLFGCPGIKLPDALAGAGTGAVVVGMPYDAGATGRPGSRFGPQALRAASRTVYCQRVPGDTAGMWDPARNRHVLRGVSLADCGDLVTADVQERNGATMNALERITGAIATAGRLPVVLGGDHSVTLPAVRGVLGRYTRLGILHFDAHPDYRRPRDDDWHAASHHGNFLGWLVADPRVARVVQFGVRQLIEEKLEEHPNVTCWGGLSAVRADPGEVLASIPEDLPYYVTIDVDCLDPTVMPSTGTPLPGGFTHRDLVGLLEAICAQRRIVGVDIMEYLPGTDYNPGHVAADVLLRVIDGALREA